MVICYKCSKFTLAFFVVLLNSIIDADKHFVWEQGIFGNGSLFVREIGEVAKLRFSIFFPPDIE